MRPLARAARRRLTRWTLKTASARETSSGRTARASRVALSSSGTSTTKRSAGRHGQAHRRHGGAIGARHGQPAEDGRGDVVRVSLRAGREGHEPLAVDGIAEERIGPGEPAHPCRRARPEAPTQRDPVHTVNGGPAERTARDLEGHPRAAGDDIVAAGVEPARSLAFDRDDERVRSDSAMVTSL